MQTQTVTIINKLGLHARAATKFVSLATRYRSQIELIRGNHTVNGKSIMGVMMLGAGKGTELELRVDGDDEADALQALVELINDRFGEGE